MEIRFKRCACPEEHWEPTVVQKDEDFDYKSTVHHQCGVCGEDFAVTDFDTDEVLWELKDYQKRRG